MREDIKERIEKIKHGEVPEGTIRTTFSVIPAGWSLVKLEEIAIIADGTHQTPKYQLSGVRFVSVEDIGNIAKSKKYISEEAYEKFKIKPQRNDILMTRITAGVIGDTEIVRTNEKIAYYVSLALIRCKDEVNYEYVNEFIKSSLFRKELNRRIIHTAFPKKINLQDICKCKVIYPDLCIQEKIVKLLSGFNKCIDLVREEIEMKNQRRMWLLQNLLTGKMRLPGFESEWKVIKLSEVLVENREKNLSGDLPICSVAVQKGVVNQIEHLGRSFAAEDTSKYNVTNYGDIVYTKSPTGDFPYGIIKQSFIEGRVAVSPLYGVFRPESFEIGYLLHTYFQEKVNVFNYLHPIVQKGAKNTINISNSTFLTGRVKIPTDVEEQEKLVRLLQTADKEIELLEKKLEQIKLEKKAMMQLLLTGIVRVN